MGQFPEEIQIEAIAFELRDPPVEKPVASLLGKAQGAEPEIPLLPCVSLEETAADKLVGFARRVSTSIGGEAREKPWELVRHLYDLYMLAPHIDQRRVTELATDITVEERAHYRGKSPAFAANPRAAAAQAVEALRNDLTWRQAFEDFLQRRVYGEHVGYDDAIESFAELAGQTWGQDRETSPAAERGRDDDLER